MSRKKKKTRQIKYIERGMSDVPKEINSKKKGKKHTRKPKMPARIRKNETHRRKL